MLSSRDIAQFRDHGLRVVPGSQRERYSHYRDGVVVGLGDMPWVLDPDDSGGALRRQVSALWSESLPAFVRLYAFGADAYRLVRELGTLRAQHYAVISGVTGSLSLDEKNRVQRRLMWARFTIFPNAVRALKWWVA